MQTKGTAYNVLFEALWLAVAAILPFVVLSTIRTTIATHFYWFLLGAGFLFITYFRLVIWARHSILLKSIWVQLFLLFGNVVLFFAVMHYYNHFRASFDDYNYTLPEEQFQQILSGTDVGQVLLISRLTIIAGTGALFSIIMLELRLVWMIFRSRQLERLLKGSERK